MGKIAEDEVGCVACKKVVKMINPLETRNRIMVPCLVGICSECGRKVWKTTKWDKVTIDYMEEHKINIRYLFK